jgi:hypothetical protein
MSKKGELPRFFNRKLWIDSKEDLLITSGLVIIPIFFLEFKWHSHDGQCSISFNLHRS